MRTSKYTQEFKDSTVQLALNSEASVLKIGADLDVNPKTIYNWIKIYKHKIISLQMIDLKLQNLQ